MTKNSLLNVTFLLSMMEPERFIGVVERMWEDLSYDAIIAKEASEEDPENLELQKIFLDKSERFLAFGEIVNIGSRIADSLVDVSEEIMKISEEKIPEQLIEVKKILSQKFNQDVSIDADKISDNPAATKKTVQSIEKIKETKEWKIDGLFSKKKKTDTSGN